MTPSLTRRRCLQSLAGWLAGSPLAAQLVPRSEHHRIPALAELTTTYEFEPIAQAKMLRTAFDFLSLGVEAEFTLRRNVQAYDWVNLVPRLGARVDSVDLSTAIFGQKLEHPILIAPTAGHQQFHPQGELETHRGATLAKATYIISSGATHPIDKIAAAAEGPIWFQLYARETPEESRERVESAQAAGARAVAFTVDTQYHSHRERLLHNRHLAVAAPGMPAGGAQPAAGRRPRQQTPVVGPYGLRPQNPNLDWKFVAAVKSYTKVPLLLKGILTAEDARLAVENGVEGIVVSNHGGRYLEYAPSTIEVLPEIVEAVRGRIPILLDGGIRRGGDVFKALALGATAVCCGRVPLWGLGAFGAPGIQRVFDILKAELTLAMRHTGRPNIAALDRTAVATDFP
jgi:isopentenyl diphosphate isomerase/L-lactate dehydrogenase-like FMN-dependent dehydrogenase